VTGRRFQGDRLVVASHNAGKVREIADLLRPFAIRTLAAAELGLAEPEENGASFAANARLKARAAAAEADLPALADDSGLAVEALAGRPGIHSARLAGPERDFAKAMAEIQRELDERGIDPGLRRAHFVCALALAWPDGHAECVEGRVDGRLVWPPRGGNGFGYDPIFLAAGESVTFGEMDPARKHAISHRADAFAKLIATCFSASCR